MIAHAAYARVAEHIRRDIERELVEIGLLCRVFGRGKSPLSMHSKIKTSPGKYGLGRKLVQDAVGIRVVLYFHEDIGVVDSILRRLYRCDDASSTIDVAANNVFSVSRYNLIFRLPEAYLRDVTSPSSAVPVDQTFEVQVRTILSEGWHEVEHDLRYKRKDDWISCDELSRGLNGVLATLETAEWSLRKIFDELAYKHYKSQRWDALAHSVLRLRLTAPVSADLCVLFDSDRDAGRRLLRINRPRLLMALADLVPRIPLTADNVLYVWNRIDLKHELLNKYTPQPICDIMERSGFMY